MPSPAEIRAIVHAYIEMMCNSDIDNIIALFAEGHSGGSGRR